MGVRMGLAKDYSEIDNILDCQDPGHLTTQKVVLAHDANGFSFHGISSTDTSLNSGLLLNAMIESIAFAVFRMLERDVSTGRMRRLCMTGGCTRIRALRTMLHDLITLMDAPAEAGIRIDYNDNEAAAFGVAAMAAWNTHPAQRAQILESLRNSKLSGTREVTSSSTVAYRRGLWTRYESWKKLSN